MRKQTRILRQILFTVACFDLGLLMGWLTTDFNNNHMENLKNWVAILGPIVTFIALGVGYWLSENSKRKDRNLAILRAAYLDVWADWARVQMQIIGTTQSDPKKLFETLQNFAASHARLILMAPLKILPEINKVGECIRRIYPPLIARHAAFLRQTEDHKADPSQPPVTQTEVAKLCSDCFKASSELRRFIIPVGAMMRHGLEAGIPEDDFEKILISEADAIDAKSKELLPGIRTD
jgi:hypothetical protein